MCLSLLWNGVVHGRIKSVSKSTLEWFYSRKDQHVYGCTLGLLGSYWAPIAIFARLFTLFCAHVSACYFGLTMSHRLRQCVCMLLWIGSSTSICLHVTLDCIVFVLETIFSFNYLFQSIKSFVLIELLDQFVDFHCILINKIKRDNGSGRISNRISTRINRSVPLFELRRWSRSSSCRSMARSWTRSKILGSVVEALSFRWIVAIVRMSRMHLLIGSAGLPQALSASIWTDQAALDRLQ